MNSESGADLYGKWKSGKASDEQVRIHAGKDALELFQVSKMIEDDSQALNTQVEKPGHRAPQATADEPRGSSSETGVEGLGPEQRRTKRTRGGTNETVPGYIAPLADANVEGEVPKEGNGIQHENDMDIQEMDDLELLQTEVGLSQDYDDVIFMQQGRSGEYETMLQDMIKEMDGMEAPKAARLAKFLKQMLRDQQRMAPHLRIPVLRERAESLQALVSVFLEADAPLQEDELQWCLDKWQVVVPFLEGKGTDEPAASGDTPARPSASVEDPIEVVDSQDQNMEEGSRQQVVRQDDGTVRELTPEENAAIEENEEIENFAAEMLREEEDRLQDNFSSQELREWEMWAARTSRMGPGVKRARVQVLVQGEGGRIVKKENWLIGVGDGEALAYTVSVRPKTPEEEDAPDPTAASSTGVAEMAADDQQHGPGMDGSDEEARSGLLPVTGERAPEMWSGHDRSEVRNFSVEDFMESPIGGRFYNEWKRGMVTDNLIGRRFGYGVLGKFYGKRDWENGVFEDDEDAERATQRVAEAVVPGCPVEIAPAPPLAEGADAVLETEGAESVEADVEGVADEGAPTGGAAGATTSALAPMTGEGRAAASAGSAEPKQASLERWLL